MNSRRKGAKNEKQTADILSKWTGKKFARAETNNFIHQRNEDNSKGDIVCKTEGHFFPFCIECKSYAKIDFSHLLNPKIKLPQIVEWWQQVRRDGKLCNKVPLLMMRYNGLPKGFYFLVMDGKFYHAVQEKIGRCSPTLIYVDESENPKKSYSLRIMSSIDFFQLPYKEIKTLTKTYLKHAKG